MQALISFAVPLVATAGEKGHLVYQVKVKVDWQ
jgi:hypothetical protein